MDASATLFALTAEVALLSHSIAIIRLALRKNTFEVFEDTETKQEASTTRLNDIGGDEDTVPARLRDSHLHNFQPRRRNSCAP
jgi:hypothetical protein